MMIPAGGETRASRERRLMKDAIRAAGNSLAVSDLIGIGGYDLRRREECI
jgi:hypothetical protein